MHLVSTAGALLSKGVYLGLFSFSVDTTDDFFQNICIYAEKVVILHRFSVESRQSTDGRPTVNRQSYPRSLCRFLLCFTGEYYSPLHKKTSGRLTEPPV